jgi:tRNA-dependent cyclodipeptide synthase
MMGDYKIEVRNSDGWRNHKVATLGVSVPSTNWQGDKLASILDFCATNFNFVRIDVTDALYRHSFMASGMSPEQALAVANAKGALWLTDHQDIIDDCPIKHEIIRWAEWYKHPAFAETLEKYRYAHGVSNILRETVHDDVMGFYRRKQCEPSLLELEHGKNFLLEELAVLTLQARELPGLRIYPGDELFCLNVVRTGQVPEAPAGVELEQFVKIKFKKRKNMLAPAANDDFSNLKRNKTGHFLPVTGVLAAG